MISKFGAFFFVFDWLDLYWVTLLLNLILVELNWVALLLIWVFAVLKVGIFLIFGCDL